MSGSAGIHFNMLNATFPKVLTAWFKAMTQVEVFGRKLGMQVNRLVVGRNIQQESF